MEKKYSSNGGEECNMAVSMAVVPLLKDDVAKSFMKTMESSKLNPYSDRQRNATNEKIEKILASRARNK